MGTDAACGPRSKDCTMIRQDQHHAIDATGNALFARKGEAVPVGGRKAPRRVITMRPFVTEQETIALPLPANTPVPAWAGRTEIRGDAAPSNVVPFAAPTMGPAVGAAMIQTAGRTTAQTTANRGVGRVGAAVIRGPIRPTATIARRRPATKRTTIRLDEAMRARLARFSDSQTLSVQSLLTRALQRYLPAINVERPSATRSSLPRDPGHQNQGVRRSVRFDPHLYWRLKMAAAKRRRSLQSIMIAALEAYLAEFDIGGQTSQAPAPLSVVA